VLVTGGSDWASAAAAAQAQAFEVIAGGADKGVPRVGQRVGHVRVGDRKRNGASDVAGAPAQLGRDFRRG